MTSRRFYVMQPVGCTLLGASGDPFRALADPTRRTIVEELAERREQTLYELSVRLVMKHGIDMTRQAVRKHLTILEDAGFVAIRQRGKYQMVAFTGREQLDTMGAWLDAIRRK